MEPARDTSAEDFINRLQAIKREFGLTHLTLGQWAWLLEVQRTDGPQKVEAAWSAFVEFVKENKSTHELLACWHFIEIITETRYMNTLSDEQYKIVLEYIEDRIYQAPEGAKTNFDVMLRMGRRPEILYIICRLFLIRARTRLLFEDFIRLAERAINEADKKLLGL